MRNFKRLSSVRRPGTLASLAGVLTVILLGLAPRAHAEEWSSEENEGWSSGDPAGVYDDGSDDGTDDDEPAADAPSDPSSWRSAPPPQQPPGYQSQGFTPSSSAAPMEQSQFEQALSPYGSWQQVDGLGNVWQPLPAVVGQDFTPYVTGGSWVYTPAGWSFQSQWGWGQTTFHYGRWYQSPAHGWVWWPNRVWGPSWVDWRSSAGYVGWAPLPPPGFSVSFGLGARGWSFAAVNSFGSPWIGRHLVYPRRYYGPGYSGAYRGGWGWYRSPGYRGPNWNGPRGWHGANAGPRNPGSWATHPAGRGSGRGPRGGGGSYVGGHGGGYGGRGMGPRGGGHGAAGPRGGGGFPGGRGGGGQHGAGGRGGGGGGQGDHR